MENYCPKTWLDCKETKAVISALTFEGAEIRFVGGCVRESLFLNLSKVSNFKLANEIKDIDIATPESPETVTRLLRNAGINVYPIGIKIWHCLGTC